MYNTIGMRYTTHDKYDMARGLARVTNVDIVDPRFREHLVGFQNSRLSYNSWRGVESALRVLEKYEQEWDLDLSLPWNESALLNFVLCGYQNGLKPKTIEVYVARISTWQELSHGCKVIWTSRARQVLKGMKNVELPRECSRRAATPAVMLELKKAIRVSGLPMVRRRLIWLVATWAFFGGLRSNELLTITVDRFIKNATLLQCHVWTAEYMGTRLVVLKLVNPKEQNGLGVSYIELFQAPGSFMCPVMAFDKFMAMDRGRTTSESPLVMVHGQGYTR